MTRRLKQFNEQLQKELANLITKIINPKNCLITISYVECSPDLKYAKIGVSILPENLSLSSLKKLQKHSSEFCSILKKKLKARQIPRFNWLIDDREKNAAEIEKVLEEIKNKKL